MQAERPLEIGQHVVSALCGIVFGDDAIGFDRCAGIARIADIDADAVRGGGKGAVGIAVTNDALADDIDRSLPDGARERPALPPRADRPPPAMVDSGPR